MDRWQSVKAQVEDFRRYLYADFPPLEIREGYDFAWHWGDDYKTSRKDKRYGQPGVYLFFDEAGELLYVGKGIYTFDKRIWTHQIQGARYIDLIPFDQKHAPFLLALEHFLICRLKPKANKQGIDYDVPPLPMQLPAPADAEIDGDEFR
ncbi:MAG: hypothetical protein JWP03_134 [Phycisphaerales bacterium]|jgi:hypothetical protein|nr:hypothetical protein [Phycisphaerales bacterium]